MKSQVLPVKWIVGLEWPLEILVVDDNEVLSRAGAAMIEDGTGAQVTAVDSPAAALEMFICEPQRWRAVVTDFHMPEMNGHELAQQLRAVRPDLPIVIVSGAVSECEGCDGISGPVKFVQKPFAGRTLTNALNWVTRSRRP
jgi:two-component system cell cycle sensor histidine kinase/response regulator CckA